MLDEHSEILIQQYVEGMLTETAVKAFEERMKNELDLKEEVELYLAMRANYNVARKKRFKKIIQADDLKPMQPTSKKIGLFQKINPLYKIAASVLLISFLTIATYFLLPSSTQNPNVLATNYLTEIYPAPNVSMGEVEDAEQKWQLVKQAYEEKKYEKVIIEIENILKLEGSNIAVEKYFYLGLAHLYQKQANPKKAITNFEKIANIAPERYINERNWFTALAYIKMDRANKAKPFLQKITQENTWKAIEAQKLLQSIK